MVRTQIQLTEDCMRRVRKLAHREGISVAELVRRCIAHFLETAEPARADRYAQAAQLVGAFRDKQEAPDVAGNHDRYLGKAFQ